MDRLSPDARLGLIRSFRRDTTLASNLATDVIAIPVDYMMGIFTRALLLSFGLEKDAMPAHVVAQRFEAGTYAFDYDRTGVLESEAQTAQARLRLYWPIDSKNAKNADLITTSVLDKSAFLLNPRVSLRLDGSVSRFHVRTSARSAFPFRCPVPSTILMLRAEIACRGTAK